MVHMKVKWSEKGKHYLGCYTFRPGAAEQNLPDSSALPARHFDLGVSRLPLLRRQNDKLMANKPPCRRVFANKSWVFLEGKCR